MSNSVKGSTNLPWFKPRGTETIINKHIQLYPLYITTGSPKSFSGCALYFYKQAMTLSLHRLKGLASNHGYWKTKGSIGLNGHSDKSSDSSTLLPFLLCAEA